MMEEKYTKDFSEKVTRLRKERRMTQKDLAGDCISRNMLSLIESGSALPSLSTLFYLSEKLNVSPAYLLSNETEENNYNKISFLNKITQLWNSKKYEESMNLCLSIDSDSLAVHDFLLNSAFLAAENYRKKYYLNSAIRCYKIVTEQAVSSRSHELYMKSLSGFYIALLNGILEDRVHAGLFEKYPQAFEFRYYLMTLEKMKQKRHSMPDSSEIKKLIVNKKYFSSFMAHFFYYSNDNESALEQFLALNDEVKEDVFLEYSGLKMMVQIYTELDMFKEAYDCTTKLNEFKELFIK